jgi:hypothetical protein
MHFNLSRLILGVLIWSIIQNIIVLSRPSIEQDRTVLMKEVSILTAIVLGVVVYNR